MSIGNTGSFFRALSDSDLTPHEGCLVKMVDGKLALAELGDTPLGVIHVPGKAGEMTDYVHCNYGGTIRVKLAPDAGEVAPGTRLFLSAGGKLKPGTTGLVCGMAAEDGNNDELIEAVLCFPHNIS